MALAAMVAAAASGGVLVPGVAPAQSPTVGRPLLIRGARLRQHAFALRISVDLRSRPAPGDLRAATRSVCVVLQERRDAAVSVCAGPRHATVNGRPRRVPTRLRGRTLGMRVPFRLLGLSAGRIRWSVSSQDTACVTAGGQGCVSAFPATGMRTLRIVRPRVVGCRASNYPRVSAGSGHHGRRVALTFDDGPSPYTPAILRILRRFHAHATFFQLGQAVGGRAALERRILRDGNTIGNHSFNHPQYPPLWQLRRTSSLIHGATRYRPCLFRPPYGAVNGGLIGEARSLRMATVLWSVDPRDWSLPGTGAIESRVLGGIRPGGIVLMHDGGGPRGQTVAALPHILGVLRHRHYRTVTVDRLLGYRPVYSP